MRLDIYSQSRICTAAILLAFVSLNAKALLPGDGGGGTTYLGPYFEHGILVRSGETVEALGPNLMGDVINEYTGSVEFIQTDVSLPGNNSLPVSVVRRRSLGSSTGGNGLFGDWSLDLPHVRTVASANEPNWYGGSTAGNLNRCSQFAEPPRTQSFFGGKTQTVFPFSFWDGYQLNVPGQGTQTMLSRAGNPIFPSDGTAATYPILTKSHWQFRCLPTLDTGAGGEAFEARAPDGTHYLFDHLAVRPYANLARLGLSRVQVWLLPTLVTDRFGNWVRYAYTGTDGWRVASITSSDSRTITFVYSGVGNQIQSISDGSRTWTYAYNATSGSLQSVTQPDSSQWTFALGAVKNSPWSAGDPACDTDGLLEPPADATMTRPSGAIARFTLATTAHGRSNVPGSPCHPGNKVGLYIGIRSLTGKTLSGPGMAAMTWSYAYSLAVGSHAPCNGCVNTKTVTVTDPQGQVAVKTFGTLFGINDGLLLREDVGVNGASALRSTTYTYRSSSAGPYPAGVGGTNTPGDRMTIIYTPQDSRSIVQEGVTFNQTATAFDVYARATAFNSTSSLGVRSESIGFYDETALWVLGQIGSRSVGPAPANLTVVASTTFDANALPWKTFKFGKLQATNDYNPDGTLLRTTDGRGNSTTFGNYMRGLPQIVTFADGRSVSAVVNNVGNITSATSEAGTGTTWSYGYDAIGRLASKTPPAGDAVAYNTTNLSFAPVPASEVGLEPGHWRQTITTGNAVTINYFDARWRKRLTTTYDALDRANTERAQRYDYDPYNRTTFASYSARSIATIATAAPGCTTSYDALGRSIQTACDSEFGTLTTTTQYLAGFQRRVTDPRGNSTTTSYQVFDEPGEAAIASIGAPAGVSVAINRDVFGKPLSITRSGTYGGAAVSATRSYVYDANQQLCKTVEPEIGATIQALDGANNVAWRAPGVNLTSTSSCDLASVPAASVISFSYDARNRVIGTGFGDGSPSIGRSYTPDGLPLTTVSNGSTWTYGYNNRRLLVSESLAYGQTYNLARAYDANASLSQLTYPDGAIVSFNPNALGEARQASGYASAVSYHPNGTVAGYTLANGVVNTLSQNARGLPLVNRDAGVLQDQYGYDANGNIAAITDQQEGITSRVLGYDGLDRLTSASAPGVWGSASYNYDPLDNLRTSTVGSRNATLNYGTNNLLATINTNGVFTGYAYDARGNVTGRGTQGFYFDLGNRMALANGVASYVYDGWGRRVYASGTNGVARTQVYSNAGGQLLYGFTQQGVSTFTTRYVYLGGKLIAETDSAAGTSYAHTDALGSPVARTNSAGLLLSRTRYEPYGATAAGTNPGSNGFTGIGFTGHVNEAQTGLVYMQQRYYDPVAERFLSVDPITTDANTGSMFNVYAYANNNPYRYTDPDGQEGQDSVTIKLPPPTGSNIPATITVSSNSSGGVSVSTTNMGMSPGSGGSLATFDAHASAQSGDQVSATLGGVQRGTTLSQAAAYGAPARAAFATAIATETGAVAAGAVGYGYIAIGGTWRAILAFMRGIHGDALPPPKPPEVPVVGPPQIVQPAASPSPPPPLIAR